LYFKNNKNVPATSLFSLISDSNYDFYQTAYEHIETTESGVVIRCRAAGLDKNQIKIKVDTNNVLYIKSQKEKYKKIDDIINLSYKVNNTVDVRKLKASLTNGILNVELPYAEGKREEKEFLVE